MQYEIVEFLTDRIAVYVGPDGAMGYTPPHSVYKPEGSISTGWTRQISIAGGAPVVLGLVDEDTGRAYPWVACPTTDKDVFQIYVKLNEDLPLESCVPFQMQTYQTEQMVAWEY